MSGVRRFNPPSSKQSPSKRPNPGRAWLGENTAETEEFIQSLRGCRLKKIRYEVGIRLQPAFAVLELRKKKERKLIQTKLFVYDRSGSHRVNGRRESLEKAVSYLQGELRLFKKIEVQEIYISDLQEQPPHESEPCMIRSAWRAFIYIKLKWGKHTAVLGNLIDDVGMGTCPYLKSGLSPIKEDEVMEFGPDHTVSGLTDEDGLQESNCFVPHLLLVYFHFIDVDRAIQKEKLFAGDKRFINQDDFRLFATTLFRDMGLTTACHRLAVYVPVSSISLLCAHLVVKKLPLIGPVYRAGGPLMPGLLLGSIIGVVVSQLKFT
ncbi:hypothetical protein R1flu_000478 [Riccia fluitans]|uniref:Uncharacterized protein n=1 Tax=Riccia fluitans TaxID=41844 RepID=A0ABD1Y0J9_9MARC